VNPYLTAGQPQNLRLYRSSVASYVDHLNASRCNETEFRQQRIDEAADGRVSAVIANGFCPPAPSTVEVRDVCVCAAAIWLRTQ
jgi:hypothetical protein